MPEYILYGLDGRKHTYLHLIDVRTALSTGFYTAERPEPKKKKKPVSSGSTKPKFNISEIETKKTPAEKLQHDVKVKSDVEKMEENIKEKKS